MNPKPPLPRDLGPMWLDLSHVIAGLPATAALRPAADAPPRRGPPHEDLPRDDDIPAPGPAARWALVTAMQLATAGATAALLMLLGLNPP
jgi:hypothetical protein